jgi:hypothetical protein
MTYKNVIQISYLTTNWQTATKRNQTQKNRGEKKRKTEEQFEQ